LVCQYALWGKICFPKIIVTRAFAKGKFPILDFPIQRLSLAREAFPNRLFVVYIAPPSLADLKTRLDKDSRDTNGDRLNAARTELSAFRRGQYNGIFDFKVTNETDQVPDIAKFIYESYLKSVERSA